MRSLHGYKESWKVGKLQKARYSLKCQLSKLPNILTLLASGVEKSRKLQKTLNIGRGKKHTRFIRKAHRGGKNVRHI